MKNKIILMVIVFASFGGYSQKVVKLWETDAVFEVPESVLFNDTVVYVSNINGEPNEKNGLGYISRINSDGDILQLKWVKGLNAPKGMGIFNEKLYVADVDRVAIIDRTKGKIIQFIEIPNSKFLNDISVSETGTVAISDMQTETIHFIEGNKVTFKINNQSLGKVNGLCWVDNILFAGTSDTIYKIDFKTKQPIPAIKATGGIDGLEKFDATRFVISNWQGRVQIVSPTEKPIVLFDTTDEGVNAADIDFIAKTRIVLVPTFFGNTISAYKILN